jgi:hypothetical protein
MPRNRSQGKLTSDALQKFDSTKIKQGHQIQARKVMDPEIMVNADRETLLAEQRDLLQTIAEHKENSSNMANQQHQNYGKTPAYIEKYK